MVNMWKAFSRFYDPTEDKFKNKWDMTLAEIIDEYKSELVIEALKQSHGNTDLAGKKMGVSGTHVRNLCIKYEIDPSELRKLPSKRKERYQ